MFRVRPPRYVRINSILCAVIEIVLRTVSGGVLSIPILSAVGDLMNSFREKFGVSCNGPRISVELPDSAFELWRTRRLSCKYPLGLFVDRTLLFFRPKVRNEPSQNCRARHHKKTRPRVQVYNPLELRPPRIRSESASLISFRCSGVTGVPSKA